MTGKVRQHNFTSSEDDFARALSSSDNKIWPIDVFKQIMTDEIVNPIVEETNHFTEQKILQLG